MRARAGLHHPVHGGPDAGGAVAHDFSTNANACGPCPIVVDALRGVDASSYPDPHYTRLRERLAAFHGVDPERIVMAASASEFMQRISALAARAGLRHARVPLHGYGDYSRAADIWGLEIHHGDEIPPGPALHWACEPASPLGTRDEAAANWAGSSGTGDIRVLDCAYVPLRLDAQSLPMPAGAWQLWTPNKALALTGIRAAYAVAPSDVSLAHLNMLHGMSASWPVGAHGVAMLEHWPDGGVQDWLKSSLNTLRGWKSAQIALCEEWGWSVVSGSLANYFAARLPPDCDAQRLHAALRSCGIKLRDCGSFGLPRHVRLGVLGPASQAVLADGWFIGGFA
ncbi:aminotransferase [Diaphorobacter ruginosibacter]|uniref:aminotransferase n=1 Tax=Diaphorobacter ruginosibacter TaxID=1715720 RepID=UPI00334226D2